MERPEQTAVLATFERALRAESHYLSGEPALLWQQLFNRLQWEDDPVPDVIREEMARRSRPGAAPWIRGRTPFAESRALLRTLEGRIDEVYGCDVSADGRLVVSASGDSTVRVWDVATGAALAVLEGDAGQVMACAVSDDGSIAVSAGHDGTLTVWDVSARRARAVLTGHVATVMGCAVSPDGSFAVSASADGTLKVWDLETGTERCTLRGHTEQVNKCAVGPGGAFVLSAGAEGALRLWDPRSGAELGTLVGHRAQVIGCAVSPDGRLAASTGVDSTVRLWDLAGLEERLAVEVPELIGYHCAFGPAGDILVSAHGSDKTAGSAGALKVWDVATGEELADAWSGTRREFLLPRRAGRHLGRLRGAGREPGGSGHDRRPASLRGHGHVQGLELRGSARTARWPRRAARRDGQALGRRDRRGDKGPARSLRRGARLRLRPRRRHARLGRRRPRARRSTGTCAAARSGGR